MINLKNFVRNHFLIVIFILALATLIIWYGVKLGTTLSLVNDTFHVTLSRDVKSGEYLGEVIAEIKDREGKKVVGYRIKRSDGSVIEKSVNEVILFEP